MNQENKDIVVPINIPLRDWFAGQALAGLWGMDGYPPSFKVAALRAYCQADMMLKAREIVITDNESDALRMLNAQLQTN